MTNCAVQVDLLDKTTGYTEDVDEYWSRLRRLNWKRLVMKEREDEKCDSHKQVNSMYRICKTWINYEIFSTVIWIFNLIWQALQKWPDVLRRSVRKLNFAQWLLLNMFNCSECSICPKLFFHKKSTICSWVFQLDLPHYLVITNLFWGDLLTTSLILVIEAVSSK